MSHTHTITLPDEGTVQILPLGAEAWDARHARVSVAMTVPIVDLHGYWTPACSEPRLIVDWTIELGSAAHRRFPLLLLLNRRGNNRLAVSLSDGVADAKISARLNQQDAYYDVRVEASASWPPRGLELRLDRRPLPWTRVLSEYRTCTAGMYPHFPDAAWDPVFCTWYAAHAVGWNARLRVPRGSALGR